MNVYASLVTDSEAPETVEPSESSFNDPAVPAEMFADFDAAPRDAWHDATLAASAATTPMIVGFVGMQLIGATARTSAFTRSGRNSIEKHFEQHAVVDVSPGQQEGERDAVTVGDEMTFCARPL